MNDVHVQKTGQALEKLWLESYPPSVPAQLPPLEYASLSEFFEKKCAQYADRTAFSSMGHGLTFARLEAESRKVAAWLQGKRFEKGDRIAVMMPNILQNPVVTFGILRAGMTVVNVNPLYTPRELEYQLNDSGAVAIFVLENFAATLQEVLSRTPLRQVVVAAMGDMLGLKGHLVNLVVRRVKKMVPDWSLEAVNFKTVLAETAPLFTPAPISGDDIAFLQYTGGTTSISKGAVLTHNNLLANRLQMSLWLDSAFIDRERPQVINFVCALPLYHIFALTVNALMGIETGGHNILIANPRDIPGFVKELKKYRFHFFPGLNTLFNALMNNADFRQLDFSQFYMTFGGGMAVQRTVAERWLDITGCPITEGYGLSETSPVVTANRLDVAQYTGFIGLPMPSTDIEIRDDDGQTVPIGQVGEICIRGPQVMAGYWQKPEETANAMTSDGFFRSGDMGYMTAQGYTRIVDRKKDMILVSGFNVYPTEVEEVVAMHPGVLECAAIGIPDEHSGEAVKVFIVKKDPGLTEADIRQHCIANLTNYKRPRHIEFRDELPKSNVGKILRRKLRD